MTAPEEHEFEGIDRLVKDHLDRVAGRTDTSALRARIRDGCSPRPRSEARLPGFDPSPTSRTRRWSRPLGWSAAAALIVLGAFFSGRYLGPVSANAAGILRDVREAHSGSVDRCYQVQFAPDPRSWDGTNRLEGPSESVLWTRGDRFWSDCAIGDIRLAIGREEDGTLWVSPSPGKGIRFADVESELPSEVALLCRINSLTVPTLVDDVLADFDLQTSRPPSNAEGATKLVWARLKPDRKHPMLAAALLEIDARSNVLDRLVLWTVRNGRPKGTVTFTLTDSAVRGDGQYRLRSHLDPDAEVEIRHLGHQDPDQPQVAE